MSTEKHVQEEPLSNEEVKNEGITNEAIENIEDKSSIEEELAKEKDKFLRLFAEFENYKKRTTRERVELFKTAGQDILSSMLPVIDDFDRALVEISKSEDKNMLKGVELIYNKFINTLKSKGLEKVEVAPNDVFDSEIHDAITQIPALTEDMKGKIIDVVEKGYKLGDKIIRYPKVVVGQ
ncbi:Protein GrpE [Capnocytophaga canis]|uniref:Protein GrpE n=1 Tax=Capnocytophaga canis TaxID=1848903 RepID=A0A0B7IRL8_9FLAO|nr:MULTISPECIES: nucleotide exchange factor GrpE [Capnocytophaga]ATA72201.1 nucleotide exchange factor GrpE [Capnocytophaga sp. H4358]ATA74321.1 nucleotide exchange factor GrpE [Capnocytophaga sp. H2931]CEN42434.1 Protein GrpE [Capnocytophaga canis]CEN43236.1 Protein GrpE [Capnocytophaga canis]CEN53229.1 Protein GrpE [Capnocytophaga canis]